MYEKFELTFMGLYKYVALRSITSKNIHSLMYKKCMVLTFPFQLPPLKLNKDTLRCCI